MRKFFLLFFLLIHLISFGQNCSIEVSTNIVCVGNTLLFSLKYDAGFVPVTYNWNFGPGQGTSLQSTPVHQYNNRGVFTPAVTVVFSNSSTCTVNGPPIKVMDNPKANFNITTSTVQCFKNNQLCVTDNSTVGLDNAPFKSRLFYFGDGDFDTTHPSSGSNICHNYTNPLGGLYTLVLEVTDTNNCMDRVQMNEVLTIWAKIQDIVFKTNYTVQCNKTPVLFNNTSKIPLSQVKSYKWDFGDGATATSPWTNFTHLYTQTGVFTAKLSIEDLNGCRDTFALNPAAVNLIIDSTIYLSRTASCYYANGFTIQSKNGAPSVVYWAFYKVGEPTRIDSLLNINYDSVHFDDCGLYQIRMYVKLGTCFTRTDTLVKVYGPKSVIETKMDPIGGSVQCEINDTVYFRQPPGDHSCFYQNADRYRLWDFDDPWALPCTTDTKSGINVNVNCRYSKDSIPVKHFYTPGKEGCYFPKLILKDAILGCSDTSTAALKLTQPDAGWDSTITPPRRGLHWTGNACLLSNIHFYLDETLPLCGRERAWVMQDSACPNATWIPIDTLVNWFDLTYSTTCNPQGWVTVGLIIKNGKDKNGNPCYDTAWYHHFFKLLPLEPTFSAVRINTGCGPWIIKLTMMDSIQDSLTRVLFNINNEYNIVMDYGPTDSVIPSQYITFTKPGIKRFIVQLTNTRGCDRVYSLSMYFGFMSSFQVSKETLCLSDTLNLTDGINYYFSTVPYWRDTSRANAGKEKIYWDIGDGTGFSKTGPLLKHKYNLPGNYQIRMVAVDSSGCRDTLVYPRLIKVVDVKAAIKPMSPRYLCAPQILSFVNLSKYIDSSANYGQNPYDSMKLFIWTFGDNKISSYLKNPLHDYTSNGNFPVKLYVETANGCKDSATIPIFIDGPKPSFDIITDTVGCAPFSVTFKNTTGYQLINWIWLFRDQNNTQANTMKDTNVTFVYTKGGIYKIYMVGEDTLFNPLTNQIKSCKAVFPDSINVNAPIRRVRVIDPLHADLLGPDSVCIHEEFILTAHSNTLVPAFNWVFDTLPKVQKLWPDTTFKYVYNSSGSYRVKLYPQTSNGICIDTSVKNITVTNVSADFRIDDTENPLLKFINQSTNATRYEWDFGHPRSGAKNYSVLENPTHSYAGDTGTFWVCLKSFNAQDCYDSICKRTLPTEMRLIIPNVFSPNGDDVNDAYDIDIIGHNLYSLVIYNRWGDVVFRGDADGIGNDGKNWNGKNGLGFEYPEGVYFFVFKYRMGNLNATKEVHGTITLIRN